MLRISIDSLEAGMILGKEILTEEGKLLLGRGVTVSPFFISRLKHIGVSSVFIRDESTEDIIPVENISEVTRGATLRHMRELFGSAEEICNEMKGISVQAIRDAVTSDQFQNTFRDNPSFKKIQDDASTIVDQLIQGEVILGMNSLKTYDNYTFQHSIDVTIVSIMIGRKLGFPVRRLRELGIGCILHDIGKTLLPKEIVNKPSSLTTEEFEVIKTHTTIGYEMTRGVESIGILPPHIALQHHEKQNGSGYPRGIVGTNHVVISDEPRTIHTYGGIAAVADIYDALSSDRPYRKALPPEQVIKILHSMAGTELNREILRYFLSITPVYPVGSTVLVTKGEYLKYFGIVTGINTDKLDRPMIRLIFDSQKRRITPIEINLLEKENIDVMSFMM
jgi:putative nucleotidyltransferase with HDIG domain